MTYDVQGNLDTWNALEYFFDYGNRLRGIYAGTGAVIETYRYDGLGRRVQSRSPTGQTVRSQYARDGKLVFQYDQLTSERVAYLYLGNRLVATRTRPLSAPVYTIEYQHTDPLGSPVAKSDTNGVVQRRDDYEPYGKRINRANDNRPGFTGHVVDVATGLTYMQQRYYDPRIGRFWSVDPVTAFSAPGLNFNRYWYANNNPYKFIDPDGRFVDTILDIGFIAADIVDITSNGLDAENGASLVGNVVGALIPGATGLGKLASVGVVAIKTADEAADSAKARRAAGEFTRGQRNGFKRENAARNDGQMKCDDCGKPLRSVGNEKGIRTPSDQAQVHHDPASRMAAESIAMAK